MRLIRCLSDFKGTPNGVALAIGNFDGLHRGHQAVIARMKQKALALGLKSAVMIFEPQPLEFFSRNIPARLYSLRDKLVALDNSGVDYVFCMRFYQDFAKMSAQDYVNDLLYKKLQVRSVTVGTLFNFGKGGNADINDLKALGEPLGMEVSAIAGVNLNGKRISSTLIRQYLEEGQLKLAAEALGRPYSISGKVVHGNEIGRTLGFPTANVNINRRVSPLLGVYAVKVRLDNGQVYRGIANVGYRPTIAKATTRSILEVNLFDFSGDLYGRTIYVYFIQKLRREMKFSDLGQLAEQLACDRQHAKAAFTQSNF